MSIQRLNTFDLMFLRLETPDWPCHYAGLALVDAEGLLNGDGAIDLRAVRDRIDRRIQHVPALNRRLRPTAPGLGRAVWVDHAGFTIDDHVSHIVVDPPGGEDELLAAVDQVYGRLLDRSRPLWELWLLTGLHEGHIGVVLKLHHAVADGLAAVAILAALLDDRPDASDPPPAGRVPDPAPSRHSLLADNAAAKLGAIRRGLAALRSPGDVMRRLRFLLQVLRKMGTGPTSRASLNGRVRAGRRIGHLQLRVDDAKAVAHAHGGTINDLVLALWTGGLRQLLQARDEPVEGLELVDGMATTLRPSTTDADSVDNRVGTTMLRLPV